MTLSDAVHPLASETYRMVVPAERPIPVGPFPLAGVQTYVYEPVPPAATPVAVPSLPPVHVGGVLEMTVASSMGGSLRRILSLAAHPLASVTNTVVITPALIPVPVAPIPPAGLQA